jgi:hypothetical protein
MKHLSRGSVEEASGRALLQRNLKDEVFEIYAKCPVSSPPSLYRPSWGTWRGFFARTFERNE